MPAVPYVLGGTQTEQQRLITQAQGLERPARWLLDQIDIRPGSRAADVGCGPIWNHESVVRTSRPGRSSSRR